MRDLILTIGIPTWNRSEELKVAIDSILCQLTADVRSKIEILVSDNASTDATQNVLAEYDSKWPGVFSINRNSTNVGFSRNVDMLFRKAKGEFALILSDDDALEPDAISEILLALDTYSDIDIMFVMAEGYDSQLASPLNPSAWARAREKMAPGQSFSYYSSGIDYYRAHKTLCYVCISGNLYRVSAWKAVNMEPGLASGSVQLHAAIQIHAKGSSCLIGRPLIKYRVIAADGADDYVSVRAGGYASGFPFTYHFDIVKACRDGALVFPKAIYHAFYLTCVRGIFDALLFVKAHHIPINRDYFLGRLDACLDPTYCGWLSPLLRLLLRLPAFYFVIPHHLYRLAQKMYFVVLR